MAIFAYGRVSTKDQSSVNQRLDIEKAGIKVDYWFADEGVSGKTQASQRPQFKAMLHQIRISFIDIQLGGQGEDLG